MEFQFKESPTYQSPGPINFINSANKNFYISFILKFPLRPIVDILNLDFPKIKKLKKVRYDVRT